MSGQDAPTVDQIIAEGRTIVFKLLAAVEELQKAREAESKRGRT